MSLDRYKYPYERGGVTYDIIGMRSMMPRQTVGLFDLLNHLGQKMNLSEATMIEIGSYAGEGAVMFASFFKRVFCVDVWEAYYEEHSHLTQNHDMETMRTVHDIFQRSIQDFPNITECVSSSLDFSTTVQEKVDFVYIDALHTYDAVKSDIAAYIPLVKPGGFIGGHDFASYWPGVKRAVLESFDKDSITVFRDTSWLVQL